MRRAERDIDVEIDGRRVRAGDAGHERDGITLHLVMGVARERDRVELGQRREVVRDEQVGGGRGEDQVVTRSRCHAANPIGPVGPEVVRTRTAPRDDLVQPGLRLTRAPGVEDTADLTRGQGAVVDRCLVHAAVQEVGDGPEIRIARVSRPQDEWGRGRVDRPARRPCADEVAVEIVLHRAAVVGPGDVVEVAVEDADRRRDVEDVVTDSAPVHGFQLPPQLSTRFDAQVVGVVCLGAVRVIKFVDEERISACRRRGDPGLDSDRDRRVDRRDVGRDHILVDAVEREGLGHLARRIRGAVDQGAVVTADNVVGVAVAGPPGGDPGRDGTGRRDAGDVGGELGRVAVGRRRGGADRLADGRRGQAGGGERRVARGVGRDVREAQVALALAVARRIVHGVREEFEPEHRARGAVERAGDGRSRARDGGGQDGVVLELVRAGVRAAGGVGRDAVVVKVDAEPGAAGDRVPLDRHDRVRACTHRGHADAVP